jgi:hypothetical protein
VQEEARREISNLKTANVLGLSALAMLFASAGEAIDSYLLHCICRLMAVRPEGADYQWRKIPPGELSIDPVS